MRLCCSWRLVKRNTLYAFYFNILFEMRYKMKEILKYLLLIYFFLITFPMFSQKKESPIQIHFESGELTSKYEKSILDFESKVRTILDIPSNSRTVENTLVEFENALWIFEDTFMQLNYLIMVYPEEKIREESYLLLERASKYWNYIFSRKDIYEALKCIHPMNVEKKLLAEFLINFEEGGLHLSSEVNKNVKELQDSLSALSIQFSKNIDMDSSCVLVYKEELEGVSESFIEGLKKTKDEEYIMPLKTPFILEILENADKSDSRKKIQFAYENRAAETNTKILERILKIRREISVMVGYKSWAEYRISKLSAGDVDRVKAVVDTLKSKLMNKKNEDLVHLLEVKKSLFSTCDKLDPWDINYLVNQIKKRNYSLDNEKLKEYFPTENVMKNMLSLFSNLLDIDIIEIVNAEVWDEKVKLYQISDKNINNCLAYLYVDLYPRNGKYGWYSTTPIIVGRTLTDGKYCPPITVLVGNWNPSMNDKPALLSFDDLKVLFHEFGHALQISLYKGKYASLCFSHRNWDILEVPSKLLENWIWSPDIINSISEYYKDNTQKIPKEFVDKIIASRNICNAYNYISGIKPYRFEPGVFLTLLDLIYHSSDENVDVIQSYNKLYKEIIGLTPLEGSHYPASWVHMIG